MVLYYEPSLRKRDKVNTACMWTVHFADEVNYQIKRTYLTNDHNTLQIRLEANSH